MARNHRTLLGRLMGTVSALPDPNAPRGGGPGLLINLGPPRPSMAEIMAIAERDGIWRDWFVLDDYQGLSAAEACAKYDRDAAAWRRDYRPSSRPVQLRRQIGAENVVVEDNSFTITRRFEMPAGSLPASNEAPAVRTGLASADAARAASAVPEEVKWAAFEPANTPQRLEPVNEEKLRIARYLGKHGAEVYKATPSELATYVMNKTSEIRRGYKPSEWELDRLAAYNMRLEQMKETQQ